MSPTMKIVSHARPSSSPEIHPSAHVSPDADIAPGCVVMPFAVVGEKVRLGQGCTVHAHAVLEGPATIGADNVFHPFCCIGGPPQDLRHKGEPTELYIGEGNIFREMVTVNRGTVHGGGKTVIGDYNLLMAYTHIAHDCRIGNRAVFANHATLAGHTVVEDYVVFGGMAAVGTFLRLGESAMIAAGAMVERDVIPFCIVAGDRARLRAVNRVGLRRRELDERAKQQIKSIFRELKDPSRKIFDIIQTHRDPANGMLTPEAARMLAFIESSDRGLVR